jgi:hypothetical protein
MKYILLLTIVGCVTAWPWSGDDTFYSETDCSYKNEEGDLKSTTYSRTNIWDCFIVMGDKNHDGIITLDEIETVRQNNLTKTERWFGPSAQGVVNRCREESGKDKITKQQFFATEKTDCIANEKDICRVFSVCRRELNKEDGKV